MVVDYSIVFLFNYFMLAETKDKQTQTNTATSEKPRLQTTFWSTSNGRRREGLIIQCNGELGRLLLCENNESENNRREEKYDISKQLILNYTLT